ncbi:hypothetical protein ScPMuIL_011396 [Solemya velum]
MSNFNLFDKYIQKGKFSFEQLDVLKCFRHYDKNRDGSLDLKEFEGLLTDLLSDGVGSYPLSNGISEDIFYLLDEDMDGKISSGEFQRLGYYWLKKVLFPVSALLVIDVQNDFIDGSLALRNCPAGQDGAGVIPAINSALDTAKFDVVIYSKDWHPPNHISFVDNAGLRPIHGSCKVNPADAKVGDKVVFTHPREMEQILWPAHCVQDSWGSELNPKLKVVKNGVVVNKGTNPDVDSYSAFWDNAKLSQTELAQELSKRGVTDVYLCGLAYDICVGSSGLHSVEHGFRTILIEDACRGVDLGDIDRMRKELNKRGVLHVNSCKVKDIVEAHDRPPNLALKMARNVALANEFVKQGAKRS